MNYNIGLALLGTNYADHTILMAVFTLLIIIAMLLFRKYIMGVLTGSQNKKR